MRLHILLFLILSPAFALADTFSLKTEKADEAIIGSASNTFHIGEPLQFFAESDLAVKTIYPSARLLFISTFGLGKPDPACSQIGWQFIYQDDATSQGIRRSYRHLSNHDGSCSYKADKELAASKDDYPLLGYQSVEGKLSKAKFPFEQALQLAAQVAGNGFYPQWAKLVTPLHPKAAGRLFWNFRGPVICNKGAEITIDAETGIYEPYFSTVPVCP